MATVRRTIELEKVLEAMFAFLPDMEGIDTSTTFPVVFGYGDEVELNGFLANREVSTTYPLVWLLFPVKETTERHLLQVDKMTLVLAVETNENMENPQRMRETFEKILMPLLDNVKHVFKTANIINMEDSFAFEKHPNYSKTNAREENAVISIWDALKVTFSFKVFNTCLKDIKF